MSAEPFAQAWAPLCMEPDEFAGWHEMRDRSTSGSDRAAIPCADCLAGFAAEMRAVGRCNGAPRGDEVDDMDRIAEAIAAPRGLTIPHKVALEVVAPPCVSCAHEPICSLRQALEGMADVETTAPPLPAGLRLSLAATVICGHYLRDRAKQGPARVLSAEARKRMAEGGWASAAKARAAKAARRAAAREGQASA